jgi:hypothetical protein
MTEPTMVRCKGSGQEVEGADEPIGTVQYRKKKEAERGVGQFGLRDLQSGVSQSSSANEWEHRA